MATPNGKPEWHTLTFPVATPNGKPQWETPIHWFFFWSSRPKTLTKLNNKEIKQPKQTTLNFYEIEYDEDEEKYVDR